MFEMPTHLHSILGQPELYHEILSQKKNAINKETKSCIVPQRRYPYHSLSLGQEETNPLNHSLCLWVRHCVFFFFSLNVKQGKHLFLRISISIETFT